MYREDRDRSESVNHVCFAKEKIIRDMTNLKRSLTGLMAAEVTLIKSSSSLTV